nr:hypothetical protein BaRGS_031223 [Batillaria attramentaria]
MFTSDFKEKNADVIPLPGKTLDDMVLFLKQIHPDYCSEAITDETLQKILPLADEYQCEAVRQKCNQYIKHETQLGLLQKTLTNDRLLLYLGLCDKFHLTEDRSLLLEIGAKRKGTELQKSKSFESVPSAARADLWAKRYETLQKMLPLADEYQCEAVRQKCNQYIKHETQLGLLQKTLTNDRLLLYLGLCDKFHLTEDRSLLLEIGRKEKGLSCRKANRSSPFH